MIAALFVEKGGAYFGIDGVDPWDEARDARLYPGPWPVVAHPPCARWVNFAALNFKRWGGEHNRPGNDGGCFASALASVRRWGGVLEHPAESRAWTTYALRRPLGVGWQRCAAGWGDYGHWVCEVWQNAYGHRARKRTWLYAVTPCPPSLDWRREPSAAQIGFFDKTGRRRDRPSKPTVRGRAASRTPPAFRDLLLSIARSAERAPAAKDPEGARGGR